MRTTARTLCALGGLLLVVAMSHAAQADPPSSDDWQLVFSEDFNGTNEDLDAAWVSQNRPAGHILCSRWRENVTVENGLCRLLNKKETRAGQDWTSGNIWSRREFKYGYFECRYRYGATTGLNNSFWLMARRNKEVPGCFEIDINEGHYPNEINMNIHNHHGKHWAAHKHVVVDGADHAREFHVYGLLWNEKELIWYYDGKEIRREENTICHGPSPLRLSSAIIKWAGEVTDAIDGTNMDIDYVRVYQRKDRLAREASDTLDFQALMQPVPKTAQLIDDEYFTWGGSMVRTADGKCHLLYSRWRHDLGFSAWVTHSEIAHAVADTPLGPYRYVDTALSPRGQQYWDGLCTHNPTVLEVDGKYYLYYMGNTGDGQVTKGLNWTHRNNQRIGVAVADHPDGPWRRFDRPVIDVSPDDNAPDALMTSNPSITRRPDGSFLMVYKAVGKKTKMPFGGPVVHCVATSVNPTGPFTKHEGTVFTVPGVAFPAEDPFIWYDAQRERYYAIVKDQTGAFTGVKGRSLALFTSLDGIDWKPAKHVLASKTQIAWVDGIQPMSHLERPQLWLDGGQPAVLFCASDQIEGKQPTQSLNVHIPLKTVEE